MEQVPGILDTFPPLADYPTASVRSTLPPAEWQACLDSWLFSLEYRLRMRDEHFSKLPSTLIGTQFLVSFCRNPQATGQAAVGSKEAQLHRRAYLLLKRLLLATNSVEAWGPEILMDRLLLADEAFHRISDWQRTVTALKKRQKSHFSTAIEVWKSTTQRGLEALHVDSEVIVGMGRMNSLIRIQPDVGLALMTGSDYLESIITAYSKNDLPSQGSLSFKHTLTGHLYHGLRSLMSDQTRHISLLLDHLYLLRAESNRMNKTSKTQEETVLSSLVCTTAFLRHLTRDVAVSETKRGQGQIDGLSAYRDQSKHLHHLPPIRKHESRKAKGRANDDLDIHVHKAAQISQVHDLFPSFSNAYIVKLLDHFEDDVEQVIAALLEPDTLPENLREPDANATVAAELIGPDAGLAPRSTPPLQPERKNAFDHDAFDRLSISSKKLHKGRKEISLDEPSTKDEHARSKAAIMAALAAFDSDDDERDDTYDVADVGGSVDQSVDTDTRPRGERPQEQNQNPHEETLFRAWRTSAQLFARDSKTRISTPRQDLKRQTAMSDEQIEGWAIVLSRDTALQDRLQRKYSDLAFRPRNQRHLEQTKWREDSSRDVSADETDRQEHDQANDGRRMGQAQIRGSRNWGRGRGGSTSGPTSDAATQAARRRKEQGRGRGAAHNRREGRAKKMGRGMPGATA